MKYKYNFYNILSVGSNFDLSYIVLPLDCFKVDEGCKNYDLTIKMVKCRTFETSGYQQIAHRLYYSKEEDRIISALRLFGIKFCWEIKNLMRDKTELLFSKSYMLFFKHIFQFPISTVYQVNILIKMIMQVKLLLKNSTFLVCGAVALDKQGVIFTGTCGSGKTTAVLNFMDNFHSKYISDDIMILSNNVAYSFPSPLRIRKYNLGTTCFNKFINPAQEYGDRFLESFKGDFDVYFLERSSSNYIKEISNTEGINKLCNINNRILSYFNERLLASSAYIYEDFSLLYMQKKQLDILSDFFKETKFHIICATHIDDYIEMLKKKYVCLNTQEEYYEKTISK